MDAPRNITMTLTVTTGILHATYQLYRAISKLHHKQQSYGPETNARQTDNSIIYMLQQLFCGSMIKLMQVLATYVFKF